MPPSLKSRFALALTRGRLRPLGRPVYAALLGAELALIRLGDAFAPPADQALVNTHLTVLIKTFERPAVLRRLVASLRRRYPALPVIVVDDSQSPSQLPGVTTIQLPYDRGVSAGRNAGLQAVSTPYTLVLDDDYVFYRRTDLAPALRWLEAHPEVDLLGGRRVDLPGFHAVDYAHEPLFPTTAQPLRPPGSLVGGLPVYEKVATFFIARTARLRLVAWDDRLKRVDHADFFTRARGVLLTVYDDRLRVLHAQQRFNRRYMQARSATANDLRYLAEKYRGVVGEQGSPTTPSG